MPARVGNPFRLVLLPTGVGEPRQLLDEKAGTTGAAWLPDSKSIVYVVREGDGFRSYLLNIQGGTPRALTPKGVAGTLVTPDGKFLLAGNQQHQRWLYPIAGGDPQKLIDFGLKPDEGIMGFSPDGKSVLVRNRSIPVEISRVDIAKVRREPWKEISPADPAGALMVLSVRLSADGKSYAYSVSRTLSDLYVVDGMK